LFPGLLTGETEASLKVYRWQHNVANVNEEPQPPLCPECKYGVHQTRQPFRLITTHRNFCSQSCCHQKSTPAGTLFADKSKRSNKVRRPYSCESDSRHADTTSYSISVFSVLQRVQGRLGQTTVHNTLLVDLLQSSVEVNTQLH